jgi:glycosyltransferase involved in cell wall biosynthesis
MTLFADASVLELPATGVGKTLLGLYAALAAAPMSPPVTLVHRRRLRSAIPAPIASARVTPWIPRPLWASVAFPLLARRFGPEAVFHFPWNGGIPRLPSDTQTISTIHDVLPLLIPRYFAHDADERAYRLRMQETVDRSGVIVTDSVFSRDQILAQFRTRRAPVVIPCATDIGSYPRSPEGSRVPYLLYVGGLDPRKSFDRLIRVFVALVREKRISATLVVVGDTRNASPALVDALHEGVRAGAVRHAGYVSEPELASLYDHALGLVYPSAYEGFGLPPLEAMTRGCPVIACRATSVPEVCGDAAEYVPPGDDKALAEAVTRLVADESLRASLSLRGRRQAALFSWETSAALLREALGIRPQEGA